MMKNPANPETNIQHPDQEYLWESRIHEIASDFSYPPTPNMKARVSSKNAFGQKNPIRLRVAQGFAALVLLLLVGTILIPPVRAGLLEVLQIGGIRFLLSPLEPSPTMTELPSIPLEPKVTLTVSGAPVTEVPSDPAFFDLMGETTLEGARIRAPFPILLPSYPEDLGLPNHVYLQESGGILVVLVWLQPGSSAQVRLSLHILGPGVTASKGPLEELAITTVRGQRAAWTTGPYMLLYSNDNRPEIDLRTLVEGHVLVWESEGLTYRMETDLPIEEAVRIAESLR